MLVPAGIKGKRFALPHSRVMLHQPLRRSRGPGGGTSRSRPGITRYRRLLEELIARHTGWPVERVSKDTDRDLVLTAEGALEYGVVDEIMPRPAARPRTLTS